jgi:hypothetical protein
MKEESVDCTIWRVRFGRGFGTFSLNTAVYLRLKTATCFG